MGQLVDTSLTVQYLSRLRRELPRQYELFERIDSALDTCIAKVERSQQKDGSWNQGQGWALVLQSSIGMTALENARAAGKRVRDEVLERARAAGVTTSDAANELADEACRTPHPIWGHRGWKIVEGLMSDGWAG